MVRGISRRCRAAMPAPAPRPAPRAALSSGSGEDTEQSSSTVHVARAGLWSLSSSGVGALLSSSYGSGQHGRRCAARRCGAGAERCSLVSTSAVLCSRALLSVRMDARELSSYGSGQRVAVVAGHGRRPRAAGSSGRHGARHIRPRVASIHSVRYSGVHAHTYTQCLRGQDEHWDDWHDGRPRRS